MTREQSDTAVQLHNRRDTREAEPDPLFCNALTVDDIFELTARVWGTGSGLRLTTVISEYGSPLPSTRPAHE